MAATCLANYLLACEMQNYLHDKEIDFISMKLIFKLLLVSVLALLFFVYSRRRHHSPVLAIMDPDDDVRENIIHYDEEGVGKFTAITTTYQKKREKNLNRSSSFGIFEAARSTVSCNSVPMLCSFYH